MKGQLRNLMEKMKNLITFNKDEVYTEAIQEEDQHSNIPRQY